jgi:hypothetical protein
MTISVVHERPPQLRSHQMIRRISVRRTNVLHDKTFEGHILCHETNIGVRREYYWLYHGPLTAECQVKKLAVSIAVDGLGYPWYWVAFATLGVLLAAAGFVVGVLVPGPWTGVLFPTGITTLLIVAHGARERRSA